MPNRYVSCHSPGALKFSTYVSPPGTMLKCPRSGPWKTSMPSGFKSMASMDELCRCTAAATIAAGQDPPTMMVLRSLQLDSIDFMMIFAPAMTSLSLISSHNDSPLSADNLLRMVVCIQLGLVRVVGYPTPNVHYKPTCIPVVSSHSL